MNPGLTVRSERSITCALGDRSTDRPTLVMGHHPVTVEATDHYKIMREFCDDPAGFVEGVLAE